MLIALALTLACCMLVSVLFGNRAVFADEASWSPTIEGTISPDTRTGVLDATTGFQDIVGQAGTLTQYTIRIDDGSDNRGPIETYPIKTFGGRIGTSEKWFDFDSLEMEIDFTYANGTPDAPTDLWGAANQSIQTLEMFIGSLSYGAYYGSGNSLNMSIARNLDDANTPDVDETKQYAFTVNAGSGNGQAAPNFTGDGQLPTAIPFMGGYSGFVWEFETDILNLKYGVDGDNYTLTITEVANPSNVHVIAMPKSSLDNVAIDGEGNVYLAYGGMAGGSGVYRFNKITCDDTKAYDASIASMVSMIKEYEAVVQDLSDSENVARANELRNQINTNGFRSYDVAYWSPRIEAANALFQASLNIESLEDLVGETIATLESSIASLTDVSGLDAIYQLADEGTTFVNVAIGLDAERGAALQAQLETTVAKIEEAAKSVIASAIADYEQQCNGIDGIDAMFEVRIARDNAAKYIARLNATNQAEMTEALDAADEAFAAKNSWNGWEGSTNSLLYSDGKTLSYAAFNNGGMSSSLENRDGSAITYTASTLAANNFTLTFTVDRVSANGWISIGIMSKPNTFFSSADTDPNTGLPMVQTNPGVMFLITPATNGTARVELFNIEITTNNFYNAQIGTVTINYEIGQPIELSVIAESSENDADVTISIGGETFPRGRIDNAMLRSTFGSSYGGYLTICQLMNSPNDYYKVNVQTINGHDAASADIAQVEPLPDGEEPPQDNEDGNEDQPGDGQEETTGGCNSTVAFAGVALLGAAVVVFASIILIRKKKVE